MTERANQETRTTRSRSNSSQSRSSHGSAGSSKSTPQPSQGLQHSNVPERTSRIASSHSTQERPSYRYVSVHDRNSSDYTIKEGGQINYGPGEDLGPDEKQALQTHYGINGRAFPDTRLNQYNQSHKNYVKAAQAAGRPLTEQEQVADKIKGKANAPNSSINHIIASGTGQNILNHETLRFNQGKAQVEQSANLSSESGQEAIGSGLAKQAAAVGRVQGYNRGIINERKAESLGGKVQTRKRIYGEPPKPSESSDDSDDSDKDLKRREYIRSKAMAHTLTAFQNPYPEKRSQAYKDVLKMTFDSPGNLRVGDEYGNNQASTGFDAPLNREGKPTDRSENLLAAHQAYVPDRLEDKMFSVDSNENRISSSQSAPSPSTPPPVPGSSRQSQPISRTPSPRPSQAGPSTPPAGPRPLPPHLSTPPAPDPKRQALLPVRPRHPGKQPLASPSTPTPAPRPQSPASPSGSRSRSPSSRRR